MPHSLKQSVERTFPRNARLTQPPDFKRVFRQGRRIGNACFTLMVAPAQAMARSEAPTISLSNAGLGRLGLAVSRKVAARAVARNRLKRIARETFRTLRTELPAVDVVLMARSVAVTQSNQYVRQSLIALLKRL